MDYYTKNDWKDTFESCGIRRGFQVLLQLNETLGSETAGGILTILEALMEVVTETGLIMVPAFTDTALDPASVHVPACSYENWAGYRRSLTGYDPGVSLCPQTARLLQRIPGARRTEHPAFSFVIWGTAQPETLRQPLDFPVSFEPALAFFDEPMSCCLLLGRPWQESLLLQAVAHLTGQEIVSIQKAWLHRPKRNLAKSYLTGKPDPDKLGEILELIQCEERMTLTGPVCVMSLYSPSWKTLEIWKISRDSKKSQQN